MPKDSIIFDLDGTLIDSAASILASLQVVFDEASILPSQALNENLIGPPLQQIILEVLGDEHHDSIPELIKRFKFHYDTNGYLNTVVYTGIQEMLVKLKHKNIDLYIATNKRIAPTQSILNHLGWTDFFKKVYALDYFQPALPDKSTMLSRILKDLEKDAHDLVYVGDRAEDAIAANKNSIPFLWATWGYGEGVGNTEKIGVLNYPDQIHQGRFQ